MGDESGIVGVADYDAGDAFGAAVGVECVGWAKVSAHGQLERVVMLRQARHAQNACQASICGFVHFSSTSCLWPGFVLSATVLENSDMNWP